MRSPPLRFVTLLLAVLTLTIVRTTAAQEAHDRTRVWASGGLLFGGSRNIEAGVGALLALSAQRRPHHVSIRGLFMGDFAGFPDSGGGDSVAEAGLLYGRARMTRSTQASLSAGLSVMSFNGCPDRQLDTCTTLGIPIVGEVAASARVIGIGLQAIANINSKASYGGLVFLLQLGWLP